MMTILTLRDVAQMLPIGAARVYLAKHRVGRLVREVMRRPQVTEQ